MELKQLPPSYQSHPWTNKFLKSLSAAELRRLIATYGINQLNAAVAKNAARGIK